MKKYLNSVLPKSILLKLIAIRDAISYGYLRIAQTNRFTAFISLLLDRSYISEHYAFLKGSYEYESSIRIKKENVYYLRRNIHRLEKGLLMQPLRSEYGLRFILETVENFVLLDGCKNSDVYIWGRDVLDEYFRVVASIDKRYVRARAMYLSQLERNNISCSESQIPKLYNPVSSLSFDDFKSLMLNRKSVRWFRDVEVDKELIIRALDVARFTPTSCNRQPFRYVVTTERSKAKILAGISGGTGGWSDNIPSMAILIGKQRSFTNTLNRHSIYVDSTLTVMPFVLALQTLGLSTCIINWVDLPGQVSRMRAEIGLEPDERVILSIAIGYHDPKGKVAFSARLPVESIVTFARDVI